ncbi:hypothetical protein ACGFS9_31475 [Streptomyces sp. NPDC048566]|uniref:hypothetical protein n=1 Tax=Streptomyces sp. NPDC048566 TaxID=3365569 RepID=UPI0037247E02
MKGRQHMMERMINDWTIDHLGPLDEDTPGTVIEGTTLVACVPFYAALVVAGAAAGYATVQVTAAG